MTIKFRTNLNEKAQYVRLNLRRMRRIVFLELPLRSKKGGTPTTNSYNKHPKAHKSLCPLYSFLRKNSGGRYSRVPKNVVVATLAPSFFVVTLELDTDEEELASSAIDVALSFVTYGIERPKSHNFV